MQTKHIPRVFEYQSSTTSHQLIIDIKHQPDTRLEFGDRQPANAGQKYLLTCHPASGAHGAV